MIKLFSLKCFDRRNIRSESCSRIKLLTFTYNELSTSSYLKILTSKATSVSTHTNYLMLIFKELFDLMSKRAVHSTESKPGVKKFFKLPNRLETLRSNLESGGAFYCARSSCQAFVSKRLSKSHLKTTTYTRDTNQKPEHPERRRRIIRE